MPMFSFFHDRWSDKFVKHSTSVCIYEQMDTIPPYLLLSLLAALFFLYFLFLFSQLIQLLSAVDPDDPVEGHHFYFSMVPEKRINPNFTIRDNQGYSQINNIQMHTNVSALELLDTMLIQ